MKNRISKYLKDKGGRENIQDIRTFFLACEFKPGADFWNIIEPFAYNIKPAFIYGSLGVMSYEPASYSIVEANEDCQPLLGYIMTITHPETIMLMDRIKGFLGDDSFNSHTRKLVRAYIDLKKSKNSWCYMLSNNVLNAYESIETVEFGIFNKDPKQLALLEKIIDNGHAI